MNLGSEASFGRQVLMDGTSPSGKIVLLDPDLRAAGVRGRDFFLSWLSRARQEGIDVHTIGFRFPGGNALYPTNANVVLDQLRASTGLTTLPVIAIRASPENVRRPQGGHRDEPL